MLILNQGEQHTDICFLDGQELSIPYGYIEDDMSEVISKFSIQRLSQEEVNKQGVNSTTFQSSIPKLNQNTSLNQVNKPSIFVEASVLNSLGGLECRTETLRFSTLYACISLYILVFVINRFIKREVVEVKQKMNIHVVLPIKKLDAIQILGISQISIYIMAANLEYSVQGLFVFQFFEALLNASVFWLTDVFFFHVGLTWHVRYIRNGFQMTFTVIILLNLFLIYLYTYIGFELALIIFYSNEFVTNLILNQHFVQDYEIQKMCTLTSAHLLIQNMIFILISLTWLLKLKHVKFKVVRRIKRRIKELRQIRESQVRKHSEVQFITITGTPENEETPQTSNTPKIEEIQLNEIQLKIIEKENIKDKKVKFDLKQNIVNCKTVDESQCEDKL
eukprot:403342457